MIKGISISVLVGYIIGCLGASVFTRCIVGFPVALIFAPKMLFSAYDENAGGTIAISSAIIAFVQLIILTGIGVKKGITPLIYGSVIVTVAVLSFWGGAVAIEVARF